MIGKEYFLAAAVADPEEINQLTSYLSDRPTERRFLKDADYTCPHQPRKNQASGQLPPYHFLRTDLPLLLGPSGNKLLNRVWGKFHLLTTEEDPRRLRPALMKLFSVAARMAAPKGVGLALRRLVRDFERQYFQVVVDDQKRAEETDSRRFALLSVLQDGQGSHLLHTILGDSPRDQMDQAGMGQSFPSRALQRETDQARRLFLFEAAYRAKSWSEAYRQARLLAETPGKERAAPRLTKIYRGLSQGGLPESKKKQVLTDLAACDEVTRSARISYALEAISAPTLSCRPGVLEGLLCDLLPPGDPWWRSSLSRLYRHRAVPRRWMRDIRLLWQSENSLRGLCRVLFSTFRYSKTRAKACLTKYQLQGPCLSMTDELILTRLEKVGEEVKSWLELAPPITDQTAVNGALFQLPKTLWSSIAKICGRLQIEVPACGLTNFQPEPVRVTRHGGRRILSLSPEFLAADLQEQSFLLARGLYRATSGLAQLEMRMRPLTSPKALLERALDYADWSGHDTEPLERVRQTAQAEEVLVALEDIFWDSGDHNYRRLALLLHYRAWCPLFEREADLFAASMVDIVTATHALIRAELGAKALGRECSQAGLQTLFSNGDTHPRLCLRLQTLWVTVSEEIQRKRR